ncbi:oxalate--CoA ligase-like [Mizuhopecten yessoensis]|uniref:Long-chain-fatty-acid--CoA ligase FadD13 n=1 Tax=Mizuhopecten yessoensis TaxID=6573 RepID=A0A210QS59_MIZYE|nr:oxalate--CoA ligase-like [Mizuhopecten yessoensis]OWF51562.1 Long-chain-fatty-acid--CoA ligase FadD13 [Mizuhopecten yessoensis]
MEDLSYLSCPNPAQLRYKSINEVLHERTMEFPDKEIVIQRLVGGGRRSLTYRELLNRSTGVAKYLISRGIMPGDSVAIIGPNSIEWIIGEFAIFLTGAVAVPINKTSESVPEKIKLLKASQSKAVLFDPESDEELMSEMDASFNSDEDKLDVLLLQKSALSFLPSLNDVTITTNETSIVLPRIQPESSAMIYTTSGSTGVPKMVEMTHLAIVNASYIAFLGTGGDRPSAKCYNDGLFTWIGGSPIFSILNGNARVFADIAIGLKKEKLMAVWNIIISEQCTNAIFFPHTVLDLIENQDAILKKGYKMYAIATGGQMINKHLSEVCGKLTENLFLEYGSTEAGIVSFTELKLGTDVGYVGPLFPGYEVKVIGDNDDTLTRGHLGEILIKSLFMLKSYRNAYKLNEECFTDGGWFRTGDIGIITMEGRLFVKGKSTDVIKRGGVTVLVSHVETAMIELPEVREIVVLAVPDVRLFEEICACVVLEVDSNITEVELDRKCRMTLGDNVLGSAPSYLLRFDVFPRLRNGKSDKVLIKKLAMERLKLD